MINDNSLVVYILFYDKNVCTIGTRVIYFVSLWFLNDQHRLPMTFQMCS